MFLLKKISLLCALIPVCLKLHAQSCDTSYYSNIYRDQTYIDFLSSEITPDDAILNAGNINYYSPWLTKYTLQGNLIWSKTYHADYTTNGYHAFTELSFTDAIPSSDSTYFVVGSVFRHGLFVDGGESPPGRTTAVLLNIDKYGNVLWSKYYFSPDTYPFTFSKIIKITNGNYICYLTCETGILPYGKIICLSPEGIILWDAPLNTGKFSCTGFATKIKRCLKQISNGNIVVGDIVANMSLSEFHFLALNSNTGALVWETSYQYPTEDVQYYPSIANISELPDKTLSFQTSLYLKTLNSPQVSQKQINIITDAGGHLKKVIAYYPLNGSAEIIDAHDEDNNGDVSILMSDENKKPILMLVDKDGNIKRTVRYGKASSGIKPSCFSKSKAGYNIFLSDSTKTAQLLKTNQLAALDCDTTYVNMIREETFFAENVYNVSTDVSSVNDQEQIGTGGFILETLPGYPLQKTTECQTSVVCCTDVIDTLHTKNYSICEGSAFTLPDHSVVKDSGLYYIVYKTSRGCDSFAYYKLSVIKNPASLRLVTDTCMDTEDTLLLHATDGYDSYTWVNSFVTTSSSYTVNTPGIYWVNVHNACGTKTDTANVYKDCDFPVYMPSAFTPNNDGKNDLFRVPLQNKNHLIRLLIYNRWGQLVFQTSDKSKGWNGTVNAYPQPVGTYIYYLEMEGLIGKKVSQKGSFVLIR